MAMIKVSPTIAIDDAELQMDFVRASGPGGQNVNKVSSSVQLRFDAQNSPSLPEAVRSRLVEIAGNRITQEGVLVIEAKSHRTQEQNRAAAVERLVELVRRAAVPPRLRKPTQPSAASKRHRVESKRRRGELKRMRNTIDRDE